jgi:hypothetical protein
MPKNRSGPTNVRCLVDLTPDPVVFHSSADVLGISHDISSGS